ncbi:MAG: LysM peptidoglycan-binding domain-containing protein [Deltaproteobacteria bacterium]|nr:MAG: LysM peptidoglycan-binding domain-containing protein [Deltaproteobacteria bacterium]
MRGLGLLGLAVFWTLAGCATVDRLVHLIPEKPSSGTKNEHQEPDYYLHQVRWSGETLPIIAKWYTGRDTNWPVLAKENPSLDPDRLNIGTKIRIPDKLVKTSKPMPLDFLSVAAKHGETELRVPLKGKTSQPGKSPAARSGYYLHAVRWRGETLSTISKWYTGDGQNWRALAKANPKLDPDRIIIGAKIRIPHNLMHTDKPMPRRFIAGAPRMKETQPPSPTQPPTDTAELELFGPR